MSSACWAVYIVWWGSNGRITFPFVVKKHITIINNIKRIEGARDLQRDSKNGRRKEE